MQLFDDLTKLKAFLETGALAACLALSLAINVFLLLKLVRAHEARAAQAERLAPVADRMVRLVHALAARAKRLEQRGSTPNLGA